MTDHVPPPHATRSGVALFVPSTLSLFERIGSAMISPLLAPNVGHTTAAALAALLALTASGCCTVARQLTPPILQGLLLACPAPIQRPAVPSADEGPFADRVLTKSEVLAELNARAARVEILRAPQMLLLVDYDRFVGEALDAKLAIQKPRRALLEAQKPFVDRRLGMGSNDTEYWFYETFASNKAYFGRWQFAGRPCAARAPIDPTAVFGLLGLDELREDPLAGPLITVAFDPVTADYRLQVCVWRDPDNPPRAGGLALQREVRLTRGRLMPYRVTVFAPANGVPLMTAELRWPYTAGGRAIPTDITIDLPVWSPDFLTLVRTDRIRLLLTGREGDPDSDPQTANRLFFEPGPRLDENGQPRRRPDGQPLLITPGQFAALFDPDDRVRPFVADEVLLDEGCDRPRKPLPGR